MPAVVSEPEIFLVNGRRYHRWTCVETLSATASEYVLTGFPVVPVTLVYCLAVKQAGTGTTVQPAFARAAGITNTSSIDFCAQVATAAATVREMTPAVFPLVTGGLLYVQSRVNSADANHTISSELIFAEGV